MEKMVVGPPMKICCLQTVNEHLHKQFTDHNSKDGDTVPCTGLHCSNILTFDHMLNLWSMKPLYDPWTGMKLS